MSDEDKELHEQMIRAIKGLISHFHGVEEHLKGVVRIYEKILESQTVNG